jgi:selenide,water dikinase
MLGFSSGCGPMGDKLRVLLLGGGHAHLAVLAAAAGWPPGLEVTLASPDAHTAYSGMVPGVVAGHYPPHACQIDLERLAARSRVRFLRASAVAVDPSARSVRLDDGRTLAFDLLSIDVGATPAVPAAFADAVAAGRVGPMVLAPCKPFPLLIERVERFLVDTEAVQGPLEACVVGAGLAGIELALALAHRLRGQHPDGVRVRLLSGEDRLLPALPRRVGDRLARACAATGVEVYLQARIGSIGPDGTLLAGDGRRFGARLALFATGAAPPRWLADSGLALDSSGFVQVDATLESCSHPGIFAAGDCASVVRHPRPKAGVYAVRQGPPLATNLLRAATGRPRVPFVPQREALALVALGPRTAVAIRNGFALGGPAEGLLWRWKDRIDRRFVARA